MFSATSCRFFHQLWESSSDSHNWLTWLHCAATATGAAALRISDATTATAQWKQSASQHLPACVNMPRNDLNVSGRLRRMIKAAGLPRVGRAHILRMRYALVTHVLCLMQRNCTHGRIVFAMRELLEGWTDTEEEDTRVGGYQHRLLRVTLETHGQIQQMLRAHWDNDL
jgi:hypothetical protein